MNEISPSCLKMHSSLCFLLVVLCFQLVRSAPMTSKIDKIGDLRYPWGVKGTYLYAASGSSLPDFQLPRDFSYASVEKAKGVWVILPSTDPTFESENTTNWTNVVTFSFSAAAQLLDHVTIWHNSGGHARINIITRDANHTLTPEVMSSGWIAESIPVGSGQFTVEVVVHQKEDFVLIDAIEAVFVETTTKRPSTTTKKPTPSPSTSNGTIFQLSLTTSLLSFILLCMMLGQWKS